MSHIYFEIFDKNLIDNFYCFNDAISNKQNNSAINILKHTIAEYGLLSEKDPLELHKKSEILSRKIKVDVSASKRNAFVIIPIGDDELDDMNLTDEICCGFDNLEDYRFVRQSSEKEYMQKVYGYPLHNDTLKLPPSSQKFVDDVAPILTNTKVFYAKRSSGGFLAKMAKVQKTLEDSKEFAQDHEEIYNLAEVLSTIGLLNRNDNETRLYDQAQYLYHAVHFIDAERDELYPLYVDMTNIAFKAVEENDQEGFKLYRQVEWGLKSEIFSVNFTDSLGDDINPVKEDSRVDNKDYFAFTNDQHGYESAKMYTYTKELWFLAQSPHIKNDERAVLSAVVYKQAEEFYQNLGLFEKAEDINLCELSKCIHLFTNNRNEQTTFALDFTKTKNDKVARAVINAPKNEKFKQKTGLEYI